MSGKRCPSPVFGEIEIDPETLSGSYVAYDWEELLEKNPGWVFTFPGGEISKDPGILTGGLDFGPYPS